MLGLKARAITPGLHVQFLIRSLITTVHASEHKPEHGLQEPVSFLPAVVSCHVSAMMGSPGWLACGLPGDSPIPASHLSTTVLVFPMHNPASGLLCGFQGLPQVIRISVPSCQH